MIKKERKQLEIEKVKNRIGTNVVQTRKVLNGYFSAAI